MHYNVKATGVELTPELRSYLESRFAHHADKFLANDPAAHADVEFEHAPLRDGEKYRAEFTVGSSKAHLRAEAWGTTLHEAIDRAADELSKELRRDKDRRIHVFRRGAARVKDYLRGWRTRP